MTQARWIPRSDGSSWPGGSLAEVIPVLLLSLLFSEHASDLGSQITLLAAFCALVAAAALLIFGLERWRWIGRTLLALQDTTAQIRVRAAVALLMGFAALAAGFGLEAILGSFLAGATISLLDRDRAMTHQQFRTKLQAVGFGALIPFFFVSTGMSLDVRSFVTSPQTLALVPVFLAAILIVRGLPALLYRPLLSSRREVMTAGLLQATSLSIPIVGGSIGVDLGLIRPENYVALVAAGLVSVIAFPMIASALTALSSQTPRRNGGRGGRSRPAHRARSRASPDHRAARRCGRRRRDAGDPRYAGYRQVGPAGMGCRDGRRQVPGTARGRNRGRVRLAVRRAAPDRPASTQPLDSGCRDTAARRSTSRSARNRTRRLTCSPWRWPRST